MARWRRTILTVPLLALFGCGSSSETSLPTSRPGSFTIIGTVRFLNVEAGCWYIQTSDGARFEPAGEDLHQILVEGLVVELEARTLENVRSICQAGRPVEVLQIISTKPE
jgi:hypothetical protein